MENDSTQLEWVFQERNILFKWVHPLGVLVQVEQGLEYLTVPCCEMHSSEVNAPAALFRCRGSSGGLHPSVCSFHSHQYNLMQSCCALLAGAVSTALSPLGHPRKAQCKVHGLFLYLGAASALHWLCILLCLSSWIRSSIPSLRPDPTSDTIVASS